jgi:hypothetical protein
MWGRYASRRGEARYPSLWDGRVAAWCPSVTGPTGVRLYDLQSQRYQGTLTNMDAPTDWVRSSGRYCLDFDGTNDEVNCGTGASLANFATTAGNPGVTFSFWIRPNSTSVSGTIMARNDGNSVQAGWWLTQVNATISITLERTVGNARFSSTSLGLTASTWSHVAVTLRPGMAGQTSSGDVAIWFNGVAASVQQNTSGSGTQALDSDLAETFYIARYGKTSSGGNGFFAGQLDDISIYRRVLTAGEIRTLSRRRGIAYEARRNQDYGSSGFQAAWARQRTQLIGGGV